MSEKKSESYLLEKLLKVLLDGSGEIPQDAGKESANYYLDQIIKTLIVHGGVKGIPFYDGYINTPIKIGSGSNYAQFEADGTLVFYGNATGFLDELQPLVSNVAIVTPASDIVRNTAEGSVTIKTTARYPDDYLVVEHQLNHYWKAGTNIHPHIHWWQISSGVPNFLIEWRWQIQGQAKETSWTQAIPAEHIFTYSSGTLNQISEFPEITPPVGYGIVSDIVQYKIYRDVTNASGLFSGADPVGSDIDLLQFDSHLNVDKPFSREEYQ